MFGFGVWLWSGLGPEPGPESRSGSGPRSGPGLDAAAPLPGTEGSRRGCGAAARVERKEEA